MSLEGPFNPVRRRGSPARRRRLRHLLPLGPARACGPGPIFCLRRGYFWTDDGA